MMRARVKPEGCNHDKRYPSHSAGACQRRAHRAARSLARIDTLFAPGYSVTDQRRHGVLELGNDQAVRTWFRHTSSPAKLPFRLTCNALVSNAFCVCQIRRGRRGSPSSFIIFVIFRSCATRSIATPKAPRVSSARFAAAGRPFQPVLRRPAAIPLMEMWMPRRRRSSVSPAR